MEENVALDTSKQKQFVKSIKGIRKLLKKSENVSEDVPKVQDKTKPKKKRPDRGLVYLSHIPHGFYEHEMTEYFKQFGAVSNVRVIRSKRTGNSKGFAFVEFKQPAVAEIVAETMNNYLMGKRLIKAACIPPEKQRPRAMRKHWSRFNNPGKNARLSQKKAYNENKDSAGELAKARKTYSTYKKNMTRLSDLGIKYDFFSPVDIPEDLEQNNESNKDVQKKKDKIKTVQAKEPTKEQKGDKKDKKKAVEPVVNKKEQKQKQQKLKDAGVKPVEDFIKVEEDADSDSSADFDSDDYSKMLENDSDVDSSNDDASNEVEEEDGSDEFEVTGSDDDDDSEADESEDEQELPPSPPKKGKRKGPFAPLVQLKKQPKQIEKTQQAKPKNPEQKGQKAKQIEKAPVQQKYPKSPEQGKRKAPQKNAVSPKKPKFEKQSQQPIKKHFKKKK